MQLVVYTILGFLIVFHSLRAVNTWKKSFPAAEPGTDFEEIVLKSESDAEFRRFAIRTTAGISQLVSALTIFSISYIFIRGEGIERFICVVFGMIELANISLSEHIIILGLNRPGQPKPFWLQIFSRTRSIVAIVSVILLAFLIFD